MTMGVTPLGESPLIEFDSGCYIPELAQKRELLRRDTRYYAQALAGTDAMQWEALALVIGDVTQHNSDEFSLDSSGTYWHWCNQPMQEQQHFRYGDTQTLPMPLFWAGQQVQEDLLILAGDEAAGFPLVAGVLCFANMWCLDDKLGLPFVAIHDPVPAFAPQLGRSSHLLMARLKPERPIWRINWSITTNDWLDLASRHAAANAQTKRNVTDENAGSHCWLRTERQCLARLPQTNAILFTIHTHITPIAEVAADIARTARLLGVLRTAPATTLAYKGITPFAEPLCSYLAQQLQANLA